MTTATQTRPRNPDALDRSTYYRVEVSRNGQDWRQVGGASDRGQGVLKRALHRALTCMAEQWTAKGYEARLVETLEQMAPWSHDA